MDISGVNPCKVCESVSGGIKVRLDQSVNGREYPTGPKTVKIICANTNKKMFK